MDTQAWSQWLINIPEDQRLALSQALGEMTPKADRPAGKGITVTRIPTADCYVSSPPSYVDVNNLHPIYDRLAFESNVVLKGPKGVGKSISFISWAAAHRIPVVITECSEDTKKYDLMGSQFLIGDDTVYVLGALPASIEIANEVGYCILALE